ILASTLRHTLRSTHFPYTTLFRSRVTLHKTKIGNVLATSSGRTLYLFMKDRNRKSACYGQCATYWPPLMKKGALRAGAGVKANRSEEHTSELQSPYDLVCRLLLEK